MAGETEESAGPATTDPNRGPREGAPGKGKKKGRGGILWLLLVLIVAGLGGGYWYFKLRGVVSTDDAYVDGNRATITTRCSGGSTSWVPTRATRSRSGRCSSSSTRPISMRTWPRPPHSSISPSRT